MKKTLAIILSIIMLIGVMPFASFAADAAYDRSKVASNDEAYIADMTAEQMASVILDWADREIAKYSAELEEVIVDGVIQNGFEGFEISAFGDIIAEQIPDIASLDDVIGYKDYLTELGGDFAGLDATNLITREDAGSAIGFIDGVIQFMADNSETFGKVFRWDGYTVDENGAVTFDGTGVFDYGKVGDYIETLNGSADADEQAIYDFYINYLVGNDIQSKFIDWVAGQMGYTPVEGETFDEILDNGIMDWFSGLCETNSILSDGGLETLRAYDLKTTDIYTLVKNFVALVQSDNQVKIDTYYNYLMDTVVRTLLKTTLGQTATVGAEATVPAGFKETYKDLALLEEISGGTAYYKDGNDYYQVTIAGGVATANVLTWADALDINFEAPTVTMTTGAYDAATKTYADTVVQTYRPTSKDYFIGMYATEKNQTLIGDAAATGEIAFEGTEVPAAYTAIIEGTEVTPQKLADSIGITVAQGEEVIAALKIALKEFEETAEAEALTTANTYIADNGFSSIVTVESVDVTIEYTAWATEDEFICEVVLTDTVVNYKFVNEALAEMVPQEVYDTIDSTIESTIATTVDADPVVTVVADGLSGNLNIDDAKALLDFINTDFAIDKTLLDIAGNYNTYNGAVGQVNHILYGLVKMLLSEEGFNSLDLVDGNNDNFTANLEKICAKANDMMAAAEEVMNDEGLKEMAAQVGIDADALLSNVDFDLLYAIDFSSVEALWVSVITLGLDLVDDGENATIAEIHTLIGDLTNLDAMAVAMADYVLGKCIPDLNTTLANNSIDFALTVPTATDAATVADGAAKDIIMTKLVDLAYEAATEGVALLNSIANELIGHVEGETNVDLPTVAFQLKVEKGADWEATLGSLVDRVYELADGIIIACDNTYTDTFDKIAAVANSILPLGSLASNCASDNFAFDINLVMGYLFDDGLEGDLDGFLRLFETKEKTEDVAADVPVTKALINASQHIVDSIFPGTVVADNYEASETVQEEFTSAENDAVIASNNMDSINALKADLVPAALNLVREAGILPWFAKCSLDHTAADLATTTVPGTAATCTTDGVEDAVYCADCGFLVSGGAVIPAAHTNPVNKAKVDSTCTATGTEAGVYCEDCKTWVSGGATIAKKAHTYTWTVTTAAGHESTGAKTGTCSCGDTKTETIAATGHSYGAWYVDKAATCEENGVEKRACSCGKSETRTITADHVDDNDDNECDVCGDTIDDSFFAKIRAFFQKIINWFKNLFSF